MTYLASRLFGTPLLIHRPKLDVILSVVGQRIGMADVPAMPMMDLPLSKGHLWRHRPRAFQ